MLQSFLMQPNYIDFISSMKFKRTVNLEDADTLVFSFSFFLCFSRTLEYIYVILYNFPLILISLEQFSYQTRFPYDWQKSFSLKLL